MELVGLHVLRDILLEWSLMQHWFIIVLLVVRIAGLVLVTLITIAGHVTKDIIFTLICVYPTVLEVILLIM